MEMLKKLIAIVAIAVIGGLIFVGVKKYMNQDIANVKIQENIRWL
jgi:hypothetical protein